MDVELALETTLEASLLIQLAIEALMLMQKWVDTFGSRDVWTVISCQEITLAQLAVAFLKLGLEAGSCLFPLNLTMSR